MEPAKDMKPRFFRSKEDILHLLTECDQCTESVKAFCNARDIAQGTFYHWKQKYGKANKTLPVFASVQVIPP